MEEIADKFSETISNINRYCDREIDLRDKLIRNTIYELKYLKFNSYGKTDASQDTQLDLITDEPSISSGPPVLQEQRTKVLVDMQQKIFITIQQQYKLFKAIKKNNNSLHDLIRLHQHINSINSLILNLFCLIRKSGSADNINYQQLQLIEKEIDKQPSLLTIFEQKCYEFEGNSVAILLEDIKLQSLITKEFCFKLLYKLFTEDMPVDEEKTVKLLNILFEKLQVYRESIMLYNQPNFAVLTEFLPNMCINFAISLAIRNKYKLLDTLFSHGWDPNGIGIINASYNIELSKSLIGIVSMKNKQMLKWIIDLLIKYNAHLELKMPERPTRVSYDSLASTTKSIKKIAKKTSKSLNFKFQFGAGDSDLENMIKFMFETNSCLEFIFYYASHICNCTLQDFNSIQAGIITLARVTNLKNLCMAFTKLCNSNNIYTRIVNTTQTSIFIVDSKYKAEQITYKQEENNKQGDKYQSTNVLSLIFYPKDEKDETCKTMQDNMISLMSTLLEIISEKLNEYSNDDIFGNNGLYLQLILHILNHQSVQDQDKQLINMEYVNACFILLISKRQLEYNSKEAIIKIIDLFKLKIKILRLLENEVTIVHEKRVLVNILKWLLNQEQFTGICHQLGQELADVLNHDQLLIESFDKKILFVSSCLRKPQKTNRPLYYDENKILVLQDDLEEEPAKHKKV